MSTLSLFAPALPSLPSYPRASPAGSAFVFSPQSKRHPPSSRAPQHHCTPSTSAAQTRIFAPPSLFADAAPRDGDDEDEDEARFYSDDADADDGGEPPDDPMTGSVYSDTAYRSTLMSASGSRKRGFSDLSDVSGDASGGGKRRILDVVGGTLSSAVRGVWAFCSKSIPFAAPAAAEKEAYAYAGPPALARTHTAPASTPGFWAAAPAAATAPASVAGTFSHAAGSGFSSHTHRPRSSTASSSSYHTAVGSGAASTAPASPPASSAKWVMVSAPSPSPTTAAAATSTPSRARRQRPAVSAKKRIRPALPRPVSSGGAGGGVVPPSPGGGWRDSGGAKRHRRGGGGSIAGGVVFDGSGSEDEDMRRFNLKLKAMIREGKEALGSKVEVVYDEEDMDIWR